MHFDSMRNFSILYQRNNYIKHYIHDVHKKQRESLFFPVNVCGMKVDDITYRSLNTFEEAMLYVTVITRRKKCTMLWFYRVVCNNFYRLLIYQTQRCYNEIMNGDKLSFSTINKALDVLKVEMFGK